MPGRDLPGLAGWITPSEQEHRTPPGESIRAPPEELKGSVTAIPDVQIWGVPNRKSPPIKKESEPVGFRPAGRCAVLLHEPAAEPERVVHMLLVANRPVGLGEIQEPPPGVISQRLEGPGDEPGDFPATLVQKRLGLGVETCRIEGSQSFAILRIEIQPSRRLLRIAAEGLPQGSIAQQQSERVGEFHDLPVPFEES